MPTDPREALSAKREYHGWLAEDFGYDLSRRLMQLEHRRGGEYAHSEFTLLRLAYLAGHFALLASLLEKDEQ